MTLYTTGVGFESSGSDPWAHVALLMSDGRWTTKRGEEMGAKQPGTQETPIVMLKTSPDFTNVVYYKFDWEE